MRSLRIRAAVVTAAVVITVVAAVAKTMTTMNVVAMSTNMVNLAIAMNKTIVTMTGR